ncbi:hypothetical protein ACFQBQ_01750 [Granulicella cerasi]|uniref:Uncharacterized protein n=1 Tax=Granulicella cerasi TaxID=741063 RepID=A0ABW1Z448_9BACT|nr:hypothetical protein [Granulicella cerasi]
MRKSSRWALRGLVAVGAVVLSVTICLYAYVVHVRHQAERLLSVGQEVLLGQTTERDFLARMKPFEKYKDTEIINLIGATRNGIPPRVLIYRITLGRKGLAIEDFYLGVTLVGGMVEEIRLGSSGRGKDPIHPTYVEAEQWTATCVCSPFAPVDPFSGYLLEQNGYQKSGASLQEVGS